MQQRIDIDPARLAQDPRYLDEVTRHLLAMCSNDVDHVELRRAASRVFPTLARAEDRLVGRIVGHASTMRARATPIDDRDVTDGRLQLTPSAPIPYPSSYAELDASTRESLIAFCESELTAGHNGPQALARLLGLHGWPFSERTFYVGPWKAARMRQRRRGQ
ncbi:MAG TPA: hypothetical protein VF039_07050 [Longimicrobiales bacterium]